MDMYVVGMLVFLVGVGLGVALRARQAQGELAVFEQKLVATEGQLGQARHECQLARATLTVRAVAAKLAESFKALSADALNSNSQVFLDLAKATDGRRWYA